MKVFVLLVSLVVGRKPAINIKDEQIGFKWDEKNVSFTVLLLFVIGFQNWTRLKRNVQNCGPRPSGPLYPHPPTNTNYNPQMPMDCDIYKDDLYLSDYRCNTTCQSTPEIEVHVVCNCVRRFRGITLPIPCRWEIFTPDGDKTECPKPTVDFDWRCDPRNETCAEGKKIILKK